MKLFMFKGKKFGNFDGWNSFARQKIRQDLNSAKDNRSQARETSVLETIHLKHRKRVGNYSCKSRLTPSVAVVPACSQTNWPSCGDSSKDDDEEDGGDRREAEALGSSRDADSTTGRRRSPPGGTLMFPCPLQSPAVRGLPVIGWAIDPIPLYNCWPMAPPPPPGPVLAKAHDGYNVAPVGPAMPKRCCG
jgi:hypothetical protein